MDSFNTESCFICDEYMGHFKSDLTVVTSFSEKPIYHFIQNIANMTMAEEVLEELGVCQNCFIKLNEYDELITKANTIGSELLAMMNARDIPTVDIQEEQPMKVESYSEKETVIQCEENDDVAETISFDPYSNEDDIFHQESLDDQDDTEECFIDPSLVERSPNVQYEFVDAQADKNSKPAKKLITIKQRVIQVESPKKPKQLKVETNNDLPGLLQVRHIGNYKFFQCDICHKLCKDRSKLKTHREIHTTERNVVCLECGKSFKTANCLRNHKRLHSAERPKYDCDQCEKKYNQKIQLKKHIEVVHMQRRDYVCNTCGASFGTNSVLKMHLLSHQDYKAEKCTMCHFRFHTKAKLRRHMKSHTGQRDYECKICNKKFLYSYNVVAHIRNVHEKADKQSDPLGQKTILSPDDLIISDEIVEEEELYEYE